MGQDEINFRVVITHEESRLPELPESRKGVIDSFII